VRECAVVAREDAQGSRLLVACVVGMSGGAVEQEIAAGGLRDFLARRLPEYMVPAIFVVLDALPLNANGKVDRKALASLDGARRPRAMEAVAPRTRTEEQVAAIWRELLGLDEVGVEDNFFILGGHSLLATQVLARIRQTFGVDLPLRNVFQRPTVASLSELIDAESATPVEAGELAALLGEIDLLSDDEARSRLNDLLSAKEEA
jgi:acyl carrier protein